MGRSAESWKLRLDKRTGIYSARFSHEGRRHDLTTGQRSLARARAEAARIYAETVTLGRTIVAPRAARAALGELLAQWIEDTSSEVSPETTRNRRYKAFGVIEPAFGSLSAITAVSIADHFRARLKVALRGSIRHDASVLRGFLRWAAEKGHVAEAPIVPSIPTSASGTRTGMRKARAVPLSIDEVQRIISALPETSAKGTPIRARLVLQWETSLRQATIGRLRAPEHFRHGAQTLIITDAIDKAKFGRELPLTDAARAVLESACPAEGLIFGPVYVGLLTKSLQQAASMAGIDAAKVAVLSAYDLRHGRIRHLLDGGAPLRAVAFLAGHLKLTTTNAYVDVRQAHEQAAAALANSGGEIGGKHPSKAKKRAKASKP